TALVPQCYEKFSRSPNGESQASYHDFTSECKESPCCSESARLSRSSTNAPLRDYYNAYLIYEYLNYQYSHDPSTYALLSDNISFACVYDLFCCYADQQQSVFYGNLTADSEIRAIAGKTFAARVLGQFQEVVASAAQNPKLSLFFGEHEPFHSFF